MSGVVVKGRAWAINTVSNAEAYQRRFTSLDASFDIHGMCPTYGLSDSDILLAPLLVTLEEEDKRCDRTDECTIEDKGTMHVRRR